MTPTTLGFLVKKLQPKGLVEYDILFAYFAVEAKGKKPVIKFFE